MLKIGSKGQAISDVQLKLRALGYYSGGIDGDFGPKTHAAVLAFQVDYDDLLDDGVAGPLTRAKLDQALAIRDSSRPVRQAPAEIVECDAPTWAAFGRFLAALIGHVFYGPGRGLFVGDEYVATHGPGSLGAKSWRSATGRTAPSFHCTSLVNFFLSWLFRRNELYTHGGNIPSLFDLCEADASLHEVPQDGWVLRYRGFGDETSPLVPDGSTAKRRPGFNKEIDARELLARARAGTLPTFVVFAQSTLIAGKWKWWHHVGLYVVRDSKLFRLAADGYVNAAGGWSMTPLSWREITDANVGQYDACIYRCYSVDTIDGSYGDKSRPIADVVLEA